MSRSWTTFTGLALAVSLLSPVVAPVLSVAGLFDQCCCNHCRQPRPRCRCAAPSFPCTQPAPACVVPQTTLRPVVETQYTQRPVVSYRDVTETRYRTEPRVESVPQTIFDQVTVDEGAYQQVWVPRLVTKQVPRTVYQPRTTYQSVPYQVTRRVAECRTETVPFQTVRYVPSTTYTTLGSSLPAISSPVISSAPLTPTPALAAPTPAAPVTTATPTLLAPEFTPESASNADAPTPIRPRTAVNSTDSLKSYDPTPTAANPSSTGLGRGPSLVPSAAQVWRSPRNTLIR